MSDEHLVDTAQPTPEPTEPTTDPAVDTGDAWRTVMAHLDELGEAIGHWAKAAVSDPDNKARAEQLKSHIMRMGDKVGEAIDGAAESDAAQGMKDAAGKAGDAIKDLGQRIGEETLPRMASAFEAASAKLHEAASKMEEKPAGAATPPDESAVADDETASDEDVTP